MSFGTAIGIRLEAVSIGVNRFPGSFRERVLVGIRVVLKGGGEDNDEFRGREHHRGSIQKIGSGSRACACGRTISPVFCNRD